MRRDVSAGFCRTAPPELSLLLCCARSRFDSGSELRIRKILRKGIDCDRLLEECSRHKVIPLLRYLFAEKYSQLVPEPCMRRLRREFSGNVEHSHRLLHELISTVELLESEDISVIPFKGPALACVAYGDVAFRQFSDLDILVSQEQATAARKLLRKNGYKSIYAVSDANWGGYMRSHYNHKLTIGAGGSLVVLELHWKLSGDPWLFPVDIRGLFYRSEEVSLLGSTVRGFRAEDLMLILCVHGSKHLWERLQWVFDIAELIQSRENWDWPDVRRNATLAGVDRMLLLGLYLADYFYCLRLPRWVFSAIESDGITRYLGSSIRDGLLYGDAHFAGDLGRIRYNLLIRTSWNARWHYCRRFLLARTRGYVSCLYAAVRSLISQDG